MIISGSCHVKYLDSVIAEGELKYTVCLPQIGIYSTRICLRWGITVVVFQNFTPDDEVQPRCARLCMIV